MDCNNSLNYHPLYIEKSANMVVQGTINQDQINLVNATMKSPKCTDQVGQFDLLPLLWSGGWRVTLLLLHKDPDHMIDEIYSD